MTDHESRTITSSTETPWHPPEADLALAADSIDVWRASLKRDPAGVSALRRTLSDDELTRADRFHFAKHRERFIAARGLLRRILGLYLGVESQTLRFVYGDHGKPFLAPELAACGVHFNASHSRDLALFAVTRDRDIGIDVERVRPDVACTQLATRFFAPGEVQTLRSLPVDAQREAFFRCWTRKEAFIKAKGEGFSLPLDQFEVSLAPGAPATLLRTEWDPLESDRWSLSEISPGPGFVGALAVEGALPETRRWEIT